MKQAIWVSIFLLLVAVYMLVMIYRDSIPKISPEMEKEVKCIESNYRECV